MSIQGSLRRRVLAPVVVVGLAGLGLFGSGSVLAAKTPLTVCASGCGYTSIQDAITAAASGATIQIGAGTFDGGLVINQSVTLAGAGASQTTIQRQDGGTVVTISAGTVTIKGVTITAGRISSGGSPGGIDNSGSLTLKNSAVTNNSGSGGAGAPGGILNNGTLTVTGSTFTGNSGVDGGAMFNTGKATVSGSTISSNTSQNGGGGIANGGNLRLNDSSVTGNTASDGGGIASCGTLTLNDTSVSGNTPNDVVTC